MHGIDASPTLVAAFRDRLPGVPVHCERVEESGFFGRAFGAATAIGLVFLLEEEAQRALLSRIADQLVPGGRLLFSSPWQKAEWEDLQTGLPSRSPGRGVYRDWMTKAGLDPMAEPSADGIHHFEARKP